MQPILNITSAPNQKFKFQLPTGDIVFFELNFIQNQSGWFYTCDYPAKNFKVTNRRIVCSPNMLRAFRRIIPEFGIAVYTTDGELMYEPINLGDFETGRAVLNVLDEADVAFVEADIVNRPAQ